MRTHRVVAAAMILLVSCGSEDATAEDKAPKPARTGVEVVTGWSTTDSYETGYREVRINGRLCIENRQMNGSGGTGLGISCNWNLS